MKNEIAKTNIIDKGETELTPIEIMLDIQEDGTTTARKLYEYLQLDKSNFSKWCKRNILENVFAIENTDFVRLVLDDETPTGGKITKNDFKITASFAKKLCMTSQASRGEQARNYFIKLEDILKEKSQKQVVVLPQDYEEALESLLLKVRENKKLEEANKKLATKIIEDAPKINMYERFMNGSDYKDMNSIAKAFNIKDLGRNKLYALLRDKGILMKNNVPYQSFIERGYFKVNFKPIIKGDKMFNVPVTLITVKGVEFLHKKLIEFGYMPMMNKNELLN